MKETYSNDLEDYTGYTIQEASKNLSVPENTLRKYLAYFELTVEKNGRKIYLPQQSMECLIQIVQLKSNGWSLKQIKDFMKKQGGSLALANGEGVSNSEERTNDNDDEDLVSDDESFMSEKKISSLESSLDQIDQQDENNFVQSIESEEIVDIDIDAEIDVEADEPMSILPPEVDELDMLAEREDNMLEEEPAKVLLRADELTADTLELAEEVPADENSEGNYYHSAANNRGRQGNGQTQQNFKAVHLTKDSVNREIANQAKRASRLFRFLSSRNSPRDTAEIKADLDRRVIFLNGLRYIRDNWLERPSNEQTREKKLSGVGG